VGRWLGSTPNESGARTSCAATAIRSRQVRAVVHGVCLRLENYGHPRPHSLDSAARVWNGMVLVTRRFSPSLLIIDDLDGLLPQETDINNEVRVHSLADVFADELSSLVHHRDAQLERLARGSCSTDAATAVSVRAKTAALAASGVAVLASATALGALHATVQLPGLLDCAVPVERPSSSARACILESLVNHAMGTQRAEAGRFDFVRCLHLCVGCPC